MGDRTSTRTTVRLFGPEAQRAGAAALEIVLDEGAAPRDVLRAVERACPALAGRIDHCRVAANHAFAPPEAPIDPGAELALIGLVSGG